jgi:SAM-dependent methyltransferase
VASLLDPPNARPVADLGAGKGNFTAHLASVGYRAVAFDIDALDYSRAGHSRAPFVVADLQRGLPVRSSSLAGVVCIETLEHLEGPLPTIREMARVVATGGFIILTTPNVLSLGSRLELLVRRHHEDFDDYCYEGNGHISPVSLTQIQRMASRLGLSVEEETYNVGRLPLPRLHQIPLHALRWRRSALGETLIVKLRKTREAANDYMRG